MQSRSRTPTSRKHVPMHSRLHFLRNVHFQPDWSSYFVKWPASYWRVCHCSGLRSSFFIIFENRMYKQMEFRVLHRLFTSPTTWLDQSGYHLLIPTLIYWHNCSRRTFHHALQLEWPTWWIFHFQNIWTFAFSQPKQGGEACRNDCVQAECLPMRVTVAAVFTISD